MNLLLWAGQIVLAIKLITVTISHGARPEAEKLERGRARFGAAGSSGAPNHILIVLDGAQTAPESQLTGGLIDGVTVLDLQGALPQRGGQRGEPGLVLGTGEPVVERLDGGGEEGLLLPGRPIHGVEGDAAEDPG